MTGPPLPLVLAAAALGAATVLTPAAALRAHVAGRAAARASRLAPRAGRARLRVPPPPGWFAWRAGDAGLGPHTAAAWWGSLGAVVTLPVLGWLLAGPGLGVLALVLAGGAPVTAATLLAGRADRRIDEALPEALETVARHLRSGAGVRQALTGAADGGGPVAPDLQRIVAAVEHGRPLRAALEDWQRWRPRPGVRLAVAALVLGGETGGAEARAVDGVAATLRARSAVGREVHALAAQARASAAVLVVAPVVFAALAAASDPRTAAFLFATPLGVACLAGGVLLDLAGGLWMARLCRIGR